MQTNDTIGRCGCGCGEVTKVYRGRHNRFIVGHNTRKSPVEYLVEDRGYVTPCWVWQRGKIVGYGCMGKHTYAHRAYWERANGSIPDGMELDHLCRVKECVNPSHIEAVTHVVNVRRGPNVLLTPEIADQIRAEPNTRSNRFLGQKYGVHHSLIWGIRNGRSWKKPNHV